MMKVFFSILLFFFFGVSAYGQALKVSFPQNTIYVGEPFSFEVSLEGDSLASAEAVFSPEVATSVRGQTMRSVNGRVSSSLTLMGIAPSVGSYMLTQVRGTTKDGRTLSSSLNHVFQVRRIEPDASVSWSIALSEEVLYPGDRYDLIYTLKVPALKVDGRFVSPFLTEDFFGRIQQSVPRVSIALEEDKVLNHQSRTTFEDGFCCYHFVYTMMAEKAGVVTVAPPVMPRQNRAVDINGRGQVEVVDSYALGEGFTYEVLSAPEEGRPSHWTGAIARYFDVTASLDGLEAMVGDPLKLEVRVATDGYVNTMLSLPLPVLDGFRVGDKPEREHVEGGIVFRYALRPLREGLLEVPALPFAWFSREEGVYRTVLTPVIPLRVVASPKAFYEHVEGDLLMADFPPALAYGTSGGPQLSMSRGCFWWMVAMMVVAVLRWCYRFLWMVLCVVLRPLGWLLPRVRFQMALRAAKSPEEALRIIRQWYGRPSLTGDEIARAQQSEEAQALAAAFRELEAARYAGGDCQWQDAVRCVLRLVSRVRFVVPFVLLFMGGIAQAQTAVFERDQALALSMQASEPAAFECALQAWFVAYAAGDQSASSLMNGVTTAYFASKPVVARSLLQRYEMLYGRDAKSRQAHGALNAMEGRVLSRWESLRDDVRYYFAYGMYLNLLGVMVGLFCLSFCNFKWFSRTMMCVRVVLFLLVCLLAYQRGVMKRMLDCPHWVDALQEEVQSEAMQ